MTKPNSPDLPSRLKRERQLARDRKQAAMEAFVIDGLKKTGGTVHVPFNALNAESFIEATHFVARAADYLEDLAVIGRMQATQIKLSDIPEEEYPDKRAIVARTERQIMIANLAATIDFILDCPGNNVEICDGLWRIYEGLQHVEQTHRTFHAFEPSPDKTNAETVLPTHVFRKASVAAAIWALMSSGLNEDQAAQKAMVWVDKVTPAHFGLPAHKPWNLETLKNWRRTLNKGQTENEAALARYQEWIKRVNAIAKKEPERLPVWAERMLFMTVHRVLPNEAA